MSIEEKYEAFEAEVPPLRVEATVVGPSSPVRDSLRLRVRRLEPGAALSPTLTLGSVSIGGDRVFVPWRALDSGGFELAIDVSERDGAVSVDIEVRDTYTAVVDGDTLSVGRAARQALTPTIARTAWTRGIGGLSTYLTDVAQVFAAGPTLWVRLQDYRSTLWSSPDGEQFEKRRTGFTRVLAAAGGVAWLDEWDGSRSREYLVELDLATATVRSERKVIRYEGVQTGAAHADQFYGISSDRTTTMGLRGELLDYTAADPTYGLSVRYGQEALMDYAVSDDGTHWLATTHAGVLRNDGSGWRTTPGLTRSPAVALTRDPSGSVWAMTRDDVRVECAVYRFDGATWQRRAAFSRGDDGGCGVFAINDRDDVWRARHIVERFRDGDVDRRYGTGTAGATSIALYGGSVWVGTSDGLREIIDHENEQR